MRRRGQDEGDMLFQIAMILWRKIVDYVEAEKYFKRIKLNDPRQPLMLKFYVDYYTQQEDWRRLLTVLSTQQSEASETEDKIEIGFQMANIAEENLKSKDKAIEMWRAVLRLNPTQEEAIEALTRLYEQGNKWSALLELLKEQLDLLPEGDISAQIERLEQVIAIYQDRMRQPMMVMNTYRQILDLDPRYEPALQALEALYKSRSRWDDLAEMIERQAELCEERGEMEHLRVRYLDLADLNEKRLSDINRSVSYYEQMLDIRNGLDAILPLTRLYSNTHKWSSLFDIYKRHLDLELSATEREELFIKMV
jgi:tetratricopeptide (TPR) repeat protein